MPSDIKIVSRGVFEGCDKLTSITLPAKGLVISNGALSSCSSLTSIKIPSSYIYIDCYAFYSCSNLKSITFLGNVPYINNTYFNYNYNDAHYYYYYGNKGFSSNWDDSGVEQCILKDINNLRGCRVSSSSINMSWDAVPYAAGYKIYRSTSATGTYSLYKTITTRSFTDTKLTANRTYYYKIRAYKIVDGATIYSSLTPAIGVTPY